jgi:hypothetical protein
VQSFTDDSKKYSLDISQGALSTCTCLRFQSVGNACKHIFLAHRILNLQIHRPTALPPNPTPVSSVQTTGGPCSNAEADREIWREKQNLFSEIDRAAAYLQSQHNLVRWRGLTDVDSREEMVNLLQCLKTAGRGMSDFLNKPQLHARQHL